MSRLDIPGRRRPDDFDHEAFATIVEGTDRLTAAEHAVQACADADGVVIGSVLMRMLVDGAPVADVVDEISAFRRALSSVEV